MYLFTRRTRLAPGHGTAGVDWARSVAAKAHSLTGQELQVWGNVCSPGVGTISWTGWFPSFESLEAFGDALEADPAMEKLTSAGTRYLEGGLDDGLLQPIAGTPAAEPVRFASGTGAVVAGGSVVEAIAAGVELAQKREAVTGRPTLFAASVTGRGGVLHWLAGYESAVAMEEAQRALAGDPSWLALLDSTSTCFASAGAARTTFSRRLG